MIQDQANSIGSQLLIPYSRQSSTVAHRAGNKEYMYFSMCASLLFQNAQDSVMEAPP